MTFATVAVSLTLLATLAALAYRGSVPAVGRSSGSASYSDPVDGAIAVARQRFARGEITGEDFERIVSVLRGNE
jgi:uncharacterized membrane protein